MDAKLNGYVKFHHLHIHCIHCYYASRRIITAQCEGMGEVGSARYEPALLPPCPSIRVLSYSNCQEISPLHLEAN